MTILNFPDNDTNFKIIVTNRIIRHKEMAIRQALLAAKRIKKFSSRTTTMRSVSVFENKSAMFSSGVNGIIPSTR